MNAGRKAYSSKFIMWVWESVRKEVESIMLDSVVRRSTNEKGLQKLRRKLSEGQIEHEAETTAELEIVQGWKENLCGKELLVRLSTELERNIIGVHIQIEGFTPTPIEMRRVYESVSIQGHGKWTTISPEIVKRAWLQAFKHQRELEASLKKER